MSRYLEHRLAPLVAVLVALALLLGLTRATAREGANAAPAPQVGRAPVGRVTVVCPEPSVGRVAVATAPGGDGTGSAVVRTLGDRSRRTGGDAGGRTDGATGGGPAGERKPSRELGTVARRGVVWTKSLEDDAPPLVVRARGSMAASLEVEQTSDTSTGPGQGLSATRCTKPATSFWFVSDAVEFGRSSVLYLVNPDDGPASVDVDVYGPGGPVTSAAGSGISVQPHSRKSVRLGALAPKASIAALHVRTETGPVVAALHTKVDQGEQALGTDWAPQTLEPRKKLVIPGIPGGGGARRLLLAVPGDQAADAEIHVVTTEGTYAPKGKSAVHVPPGTVASIGLADALSQRAAAIRITSDVPVIASAAVSSDDGLAYVAAVTPLDGAAVIADNGQDGSTSRLLLSAPLKAGAVRVKTLGPKGTAGRSEAVRVPSARTVSVKLSRPGSGEGNYAVAVTPVESSGPVYAARVLRQEAEGKTNLTLLPLRTSRGWVRVPDTEESLSAVISAP